MRRVAISFCSWSNDVSQQQHAYITTDIDGSGGRMWGLYDLSPAKVRMLNILKNGLRVPEKPPPRMTQTTYDQIIQVTTYNVVVVVVVVVDVVDTGTYMFTTHRLLLLREVRCDRVQ
jgi:hypothetical protein